MKRALHQAIVFFTLLLIVTLIRLPYGSYRETVLSRSRAMLTPHGVSIDFAELALTPPLRLLAAKINMLFPIQHFPFPISVESANLALYPLSLLRLVASGDGELSLYQGRILYDFHRSFFGNTLSLSGSFENIALSAHPILGSYGLSGTLEGKFSGILQELNGILAPKTGTGSIALRNGSFAGGMRLLSFLPIPEIREINLVLQSELSESAATLKALTLNCSMGSFNGTGKLLRKDLSRLLDGRFSGTIHLSEEGKKAFGGYLALAAQVPVENPPSDWDLSVVLDKGRMPQAKVSVRS